MYSMDLNDTNGYIVTGHDKYLSLWKLYNGEFVWEKRIDKKFTNNSD